MMTNLFSLQEFQTRESYSEMRDNFQLTYDKLIIINAISLLPSHSQKDICSRYNSYQTSLTQLRSWCTGQTMWGAGKNKLKRVNNIDLGVKLVSEAKPQSPAPAPVQRASLPGRFEPPGTATGTSMGRSGLEVCNRCESHNSTHTTAVKTMTCIIGVCGFCWKRGHAKDICFNNPQSPYFKSG